MKARYCVLIGGSELPPSSLPPGTHKRDFATVTLIPGRCFDRGGGGGIEFYNNRGEDPNFSIFPESLGPKESDWCSFQVD